MHSEEYLLDERLDWYNQDFMELMARRWDLASRRVVADVGCGLCHWSRILAPFLPGQARVYGIDREPGWVARSELLAPWFARQGCGLELRQADAAATGLPDASCDLVTCQTLLIHVPDRLAVLREFRRILKPGGLVVCAEPNNLVNSLIWDGHHLEETEAVHQARFTFNLRYALGKARLGQGVSAGVEAIPDLMARAGFEGMRACVSDRFDVVPVDSPADLDSEFDQFRANEYAKARDYWRACGGSEADYEAYWQLEARATAGRQARLDSGSWLACSGGLMYLFWASRP